jgi:hypothetical protein
MESVIIVAPCAYDDELKLRLEREWKVLTSASGGWVVEDHGSRVYVSRNNTVRDELEPAVLERISATIGAPVFYSVDFSDLDLCRRVLVVLADDARLLIDNDHGVLLPGSEFVRVLRHQPDWDWRRDAL